LVSSEISAAASTGHHAHKRAASSARKTREQRAALVHAVAGPVSERPRRGVEVPIAALGFGVDRDRRGAVVAEEVLRLAVYEHRRFADSGEQHLSLLGVGELVRRDRVVALDRKRSTRSCRVRWQDAARTRRRPASGRWRPDHAHTFIGARGG
jgi:hypothetical protein